MPTQNCTGTCVMYVKQTQERQYAPQQQVPKRRLGIGFIKSSFTLIYFVMKFTDLVLHATIAIYSARNFGLCVLSSRHESLIR